MSSYDEASVLEVLDKVSRSVVNVSTIKLLHHIFYRAVPVKGMGSGTIIDPEGQILTNNYVVAGAEKIGVTLTDGRVLEGRVIGTCSTHDVAIIKVKEENLPAAKLGDSDKLRVGQRVFAIGNPFGLAGGPTVTSGVISALNRSIDSQRGMIENLVQTDAAINPGNSGGPLVDMHGRVVAINTAIIPFAQGIGFAIPINSAKKCTNEIIVHGSMIRPWLGVSGLTVTREVASYYGLPVDRGVLVTRVIPESPADHAEIVAGDVVLKFAGADTNSIERLVKEIQKRKAGEKVEILILRDSKRWVVEAVLERTP
ncbi:MAG: trypsin-like peptidase domain-containing protein [Candidatus Bathyarchaeota archaeon]|nr:trypsin-like peptidase domain-containing protein [Candidatus Bathyarchaeota archaeon]MDH5418816.1 trypsin-like peptidase domain-containing protein [Candidatus Bathyarchaeota archaeon]MDH5623185.1 trypsin-like peptidase domain-containing protein [Candidatus Bathyarchaeota archaeon]MDH5635150.1 trypsin-like peptidase domain-containing protein [Candidatus Bathyarchaeota archaeon]MDH5701346.1 trypsin-like peptidase domain-containing protein [Candidatus Bathyarchaeota archaeon]